MKKLGIILGVLLICMVCTSENVSTVDRIIENYQNYKEESLKDRRFKHEDIVALIKKLEGNDLFSVKEEGKSIQGRSIYSVSLGTGPIKVLLWSQMHGDEATATMAIFDLFNFFSESNEFDSWKEEILSRTTLVFIPMLNPDGAEVFTRRNALGVDLNRDAVRLQSPEARILKNKRDETKADFGFNLHDQGRVYSVGNTDHPATISFLSPAYNYEKEVNEVRQNSINLTSQLTKKLSGIIPGQIAKYSDDFEPRAFGDNIQKWGTSLILIESGGKRGDREKQEIRRFNFIALIQSFESIAHGDYKKDDGEAYHALPFNDRLFFDLLLSQVTIEQDGVKYEVDLAINHEEVNYNNYRNFYLKGSIEDIGDLSIFYGYEKMEGKGYDAVPAIVSSEILSYDKIGQVDVLELLKKGIGYIKVQDEVKVGKSGYAINILTKEANLPEQNFKIGDKANFFLKQGDVFKFAVINGHLIDLENPDLSRAYGIVY
ncbi:MAG: M14 family zinc carboxypeptidase [Cyclobacteriaceae bacterium]|nr:M14 family zinc carboxypeptidase [Cyclobacteriaceae bacterium]